MTESRMYFLAHGGIVQGVGFRHFTQKRAAQYNLTGWVRNTHNNKVEGEAQGAEADVKAFLREVDRGPRHAHVVRLDREEREVVEGEEAFEVRH